MSSSHAGTHRVSAVQGAGTCKTVQCHQSAHNLRSDTVNNKGEINMAAGTTTPRPNNRGNAPGIRSAHFSPLTENQTLVDVATVKGRRGPKVWPFRHVSDGNRELQRWQGHGKGWGGEDGGGSNLRGRATFASSFYKDIRCCSVVRDVTKVTQQPENTPTGQSHWSISHVGHDWQIWCVRRRKKRNQLMEDSRTRTVTVGVKASSKEWSSGGFIYPIWSLGQVVRGRNAGESIAASPTLWWGRCNALGHVLLGNLALFHLCGCLFYTYNPPWHKVKKGSGSFASVWCGLCCWPNKSYPWERDPPFWLFAGW